MNIIKSKNYNFFIFFFICLTFLMSNSCINAQTETESKNNSTPEQTHSSENNTEIKKSDNKSSKTQVNESTNPKSDEKNIKESITQQSDESGISTNKETPSSITPEETDSFNINPKPSSKKSDQKPPPSINSDEEKFNLPEVSDKEINQNLISNQKTLSQNHSKNIILTFIAWVFIILGISIILKIIISNLNIPKNFEPHIYTRHIYKSNKKRNKYKFNYNNREGK